MEQRRRDWILAATVLVSAWLLFQVQPMAGKRILPWFGGGPAVWTTAMLFFQAALLGGYLYAHLIAETLRPRTQALVHASLLGVAVLLLIAVGVIAGDRWKPVGSESPRLHILVILAATVGLPYVLLAATAPLVQSWWARRHGAGSPYRLYALSNFGSLAALVSYPLVIEPLVGLSTQGVVWSVLFGIFAVLCVTSAWSTFRVASKMPTAVVPHEIQSASEAPYKRARAFEWVFWLALPACASAMLLAVTNYLCQDVASMPLLWVAPLTVYLLTFIVAFDADRWYVRWGWLAGLGVASLAACWSWRQGLSLSLGWHLVIHLALLLAVGMVCHGEVARLRPPASRLTSFYLCIALGGALGGLLVAVVAPLVFSEYYELQVSMLAAWVLVMAILLADRGSLLYNGNWYGAWIVIFLLWAMLGVLSERSYSRGRRETIASARNFFGVLKVRERPAFPGGPLARFLVHGRISHGTQFTDGNRRRQSTTYFTKASGIGRLLTSLPADGPHRVGIVGLGAGTIAAYAESGDEYQFYDIDPQVVAFADRYFTYLADARDRGAQVTIVDGDARLALEREPPQQFDVLAVDAFSGDSIPVHLLTLEAFGVYLRHLRDPAGVLAVHISNGYLDLAPVVLAAAELYGLQARLVTNKEDRANGTLASVWILLAREGVESPIDAIGEPIVAAGREGRVVWTDDYSAIWPVLNSNR